MREKVITVAEAGVNHNGSLKNAKKPVDVAPPAGCNFVKFQTFKTELNTYEKRKESRVLGKKHGYGEITI